jgi:hypothetical protein
MRDRFGDAALVPAGVTGTADIPGYQARRR